MKIFLLTMLFIPAALSVPSEASGEPVYGKTSISSAAAVESDDAFLEDLSRRSFRFFIDNADPKTGLVLDRARADGSSGDTNHASAASIASTGFGLSALCIGAQRGWMDPGEAASRASKTLEFFAEKAYNTHGWFYHWMDAGTGERIWGSEVSSIDTAILLAGVLTAKQCFSSDSRVGALADKIYRRVDFKWMLNGDKNILSHGWRPETGFIPHRWEIHSEAMLLYLLGIGSPSFPLSASSWRAWKRPVLEYGDFRYISGAEPLFIHQYSQAWINFRGRKDKGTDWFDNSVRATKANRQMCLDLAIRFPGYTADIWGITASDGASGYMVWGGPLPTSNIDGTVAPSAAGGSLMLTPEIALPALKAMKNTYGDRLYNIYGFTNAFNPSNGWFDADVIGIDTGIILLSAENLRSGSVWMWFMANPEVTAALKTAGVN
ncbi:MAG: glucoamylase family protein [Elusimicrobiota bacterium]